MNESYRRRIGLHRTSAPRTVAPHPSRGGSTGYDVAFRLDQVQRYLNDDLITASESSVRRWMIRIVPLLSTGNKAQVQLSGEYLHLLVFHRGVYPRATAHEVIAFIASNATIPKIFRPSEIYMADKRLGLTKKVVSTTAYQALTAHNLARGNLFWTQPAPVGIAGVPRAQLIDMDECAVFIDSVNSRFGKSFRGVRLRDPGPYGHYVKYTLMLATRALDG
ncbi:hypothetical protein B484DRAFT_457564 [Ochromonadaceae sp. CCMP2298]|nr:hypothetical protein B484DRAFT_457564 [Ochromonadaceae sp. CCMP2298]